MKTVKTLLFLALVALLLSPALPALGTTLSEQPQPVIPDQVFTGWPIRPAFYIPGFPASTYEVLDYDNFSAGDASIIAHSLVDGTSLTIFFTILKAPMPAVNPIPDQVYTGEPITPDFTLNPALHMIYFTAVYENNTAPGTATVKVSSKDSNIEPGSVTANFRICKPLPDISQVVPDTYLYDGTAHKPEVVITDGAYTLVEGTDYTLSYQNNTDVDSLNMPRIIATGTGIYSGTKTAGFTIQPIMIQLPKASNPVYTGLPQSGVPEGADYIREHNITETNVGNYTTYVYPKSLNYHWAVSSTYSIWELKWQITQAELPAIGPIPAQEYTGQPIIPALTLSPDLPLDNFNITYQNNTAIGKATVTLASNGTNVKAGSVSAEFTISPKALPDISAVSPGLYLYSGEENKPTAVITDGTYTLVEGTDYTLSYQNNVNAGWALVTATGRGNYTGEKSRGFLIHRMPIDHPPVARYTYTGAIQTGYSDTKQYYFYTGTNTATNVGTYNVELRTTTNYEWSNPDSGYDLDYFNTVWHIDQAELPVIVPIPEQVYTGLPITPALTLTPALPLDNFDITWLNNTAAGTATVTLKSKGVNVEAGSVSATFTIKPAALPAIGPIPEQVYTGSPITPALTLTPALPLNNFDIIWLNNTAAGTATVTLKSRGVNVEAGSVSATFLIRKALPAITSLAYTAVPYDGSAKTPAVTITGLTEGLDFTVIYKDNTAVGRAEVTATGAGNYTGSSAAYFDITHTHAWGTWAANDDGTHSRACKNAPAHTETADCTYTDTVLAPTCTEGGYTEHICTVCGYTYQDALTKATGHAWGEWAANQDGTHSRVCKNAPAHTETADCTYTDTVVAPTCTEGGYTKHTCEDCGYTYQDAATEAAGHDWGEWAANQDSTHSRICRNDASHVQTAAHAPGGWETLIKATDLREGEAVQACLVCGGPAAFKTLPKLIHLQGRTACLEGEAFPGQQGRGFRIRYMYLPLDVSQEGVREFRVIASNRYVIGTFSLTVKEGKALFTFTPISPEVIISEPYLTVFTGSPEGFEEQDLDTLKDQALQLDTWLPLNELPGTGDGAFLFLRLGADFDTTGKELLTGP